MSKARRAPSTHLQRRLTAAFIFAAGAATIAAAAVVAQQNIVQRAAGVNDTTVAARAHRLRCVPAFNRLRCVPAFKRLRCGASLHSNGCGTSLRSNGCGASLHSNGCGASLHSNGCGASLRSNVCSKHRSHARQELCVGGSVMRRGQAERNSNIGRMFSLCRGEWGPGRRMCVCVRLEEVEGKGRRHRCEGRRHRCEGWAAHV
eukprot:366520-Chlamydomonas_euryale.AAC.18